MRIKLIVIGRLKNNNIRELINDYKKRLKIFCNLEIIELKDKGLVKEADNIRNNLISNNYILDENGVEYDSLSFSQLFKDRKEICFIIGGHNGIDKKLKEQYKKLSLSKMTLTHEMARLFLIEQIYRSFMILNNKSYHK